MLAVRLQIRQEVKSRMSDEAFANKDLILLKIAKSTENNPGKSFRRMGADEFYFEGGMYDVLRSEDKGDETWYWCYQDVEETLMLSRALEIINQLFGHEAGTEKQKMALLVFFPQFITNPLPPLSAPSAMALEALSLTELKISFPEGFTNPPFIPPSIGTWF
jgi:hypothetical protein